MPSEPNDTDIAKLIQVLAENLINSKKLEWHKIVLRDSRKGFALFFDDSKWELVDSQIVEIKV